MPRNGSGIYSLPSGSLATDGTTALATTHNTPIQDLATDANTVRPVAAGGTGSSTGAGVRDNLDLAGEFSARTAANATSAATHPNGTTFLMAGHLYKVDSTKTGANSCTNDLSVDGIIPCGNVHPEHFGALGDGTNDDHTAFQAAVDWCKTETVGIYGVPGSTYRLTDTVWMGNDNANTGLPRAIGNNAIIKAEFSNKPIFDLVGIENGRRFVLDGWRFYEISGTYVPTAAIVMGRPTLGAGTASSGNALISNNTIDGYFSVACLYNVQSESNRIVGNRFFNYRTSGHAAAFVRHDYYEDCVNLDVGTISGTFDPTESVSFSPSGAAGTIIRPMVDLGSATGRVWVHVTSGTPANGDTMTGGTSTETALVTSSSVAKIPAASIKPTLGLNDTSTSSLQLVHDNYFNLVNGEGDASGYGDPVVFISDWVDFDISNNNFNHNISNTYGVQLHFQQDQTRAAGSSTACQVKARYNYHHSVHLYSMTFGDPSTGGGSYKEMILGPTHSTGTSVSARLKYLGAAVATISDIRVDTDFPQDYRGCNVVGGGNIFHIRNFSTGAFLYDDDMEGTLYCDSTTAITAGGNGVNRLNIICGDLGFKRAPPEFAVTLATNAFSAFRTMHNVNAEGASPAADDIDTINVTNSFKPNGDILWLRAADATDTIVAKDAVDNIVCKSGDVTLSASSWTGFLYSIVDDKWYEI